MGSTMKISGYFSVFLSFLFCVNQVCADETSYFNLRLKKAPMVQTLQQLALTQNVNLLIDDQMQGTLSLQLDHTNMDQLLHIVARARKLDLTYQDKVYYLIKDLNEVRKQTVSDDLNAHQQGTNQSLKANVNNDPPLRTESIKLHFAKAAEIAKSLTSGSGSLLSEKGSLTYDDRSNLLIIKDNSSSLANVRHLIHQLDQPIEQIAIEARIVSVNNENLNELGVSWSAEQPISNQNRGIDGKSGFNINLPMTNTPAITGALRVAKINGVLLDLELSALEREHNLTVIANPKLLTTNKKAASIKQGTELPYVQTNEKTGSQTVEFREAVLGLEVTPHISKDNNILLDLVVSQNSPGSRVASGEGEVVSIDKQEINTQVFAHDGETIVLGGVFQDTISKGTDKVPLLGDIPVLKYLFSKDSERHQKRELVIFVTPHIVRSTLNSQ